MEEKISHEISHKEPSTRENSRLSKHLKGYKYSFKLYPRWNKVNPSLRSLPIWSVSAKVWSDDSLPREEVEIFLDSLVVKLQPFHRELINWVLLDTELSLSAPDRRWSTAVWHRSVSLGWRVLNTYQYNETCTIHFEHLLNEKMQENVCGGFFYYRGPQ